MRSKEGKYPATGSLWETMTLNLIVRTELCSDDVRYRGDDRKLVFPRGVLPDVDMIFDLQSLSFNPVSHPSFFTEILSFVAHSSCLPQLLPS